MRLNLATRLVRDSCAPWHAHQPHGWFICDACLWVGRWACPSAAVFCPRLMEGSTLDVLAFDVDDAKCRGRRVRWFREESPGVDDKLEATLSLGGPNGVIFLLNQWLPEDVGIFRPQDRVISSRSLASLEHLRPGSVRSRPDARKRPR